MVAIAVGTAKIELPALIAPGHADDSVSLTVGHGRTSTGSVGTGIGVDVGPLRKSENFWIASGATITKTSRRVELARNAGAFRHGGPARSRAKGRSRSTRRSPTS